MNILLVQTSNAGTAYWRLYNYWVAAERTRKCGMHVLGWDKDEIGSAPWQYQISQTEHQPKLFGMLYQAGVQADAIVFQRVETHFALTAFYAMRDQFPGKPILTELDDDIFDVANYNAAAESLKPGSELTSVAIAQMKNSDGLIVSTPYLKEVYSEFCPNIYVVPNSIDVQKWDKAKRKRKSGVRIGWIGGASHVEDIRMVEGIIDPVVEKNPDAKFVFVSSALPDFLKNRKGVEVVEKWAPILKYPSHIAAQDFDIGIAPLRDNKFNRAKSNLRWLEYSGFGIPTVASHVGHFAETIKQGVDGFLAKTPDEFAAHLNHLISDKKARKRMGAAAHARIATDFNVDRNLDIYIDAITDCLSRPTLEAPSMATGFDEVKEEFDLPGVEMGPLEMSIPEAIQ